MLRTIFLAGTALATLAATQADAALTISKKATANVTCSGGVCTGTGPHSNMNATDLSSMLASSDITIANGTLTKDIDVTAAVTWASTHKLTLDSRRTVNIQKPINVTGTGALAIKLNDGGSDGSLNFYPAGNITFLDTASSFSLDGANFTLVADIQTLASDIATAPSGAYALARSYDAGPDGVYSAAPVATTFQGHFEGLGNTIRKLKIRNSTAGSQVGLFASTNEAIISDVKLTGVKVTGGKQSSIGALAGLCSGSVTNVDVSGSVSGNVDSNIGGVCGVVTGHIVTAHSSGTVSGVGNKGTTQSAGGLAGQSQGLIGYSSSSAKVNGAKGWTIGGLVGQNTGDVFSSSATGVVITGDDGTSGGLVGSSTGDSIVNSYATGFAGGGVSSVVGGFIGFNNAGVTNSYSSGGVASGSGNAVGGFIGTDAGASDLTDTYFDTTTSGQSHGVGSDTGYPGITGLTTDEFQAGLPSGFSSSLWAQDPEINGGLPYLVAVPPG